MCLDSVSVREEIPSGLIVSGYKAFKTGTWGGKLQFGVQSGTVELDKWITAKPTKIGHKSHEYQAGFHVYSDETERNGTVDRGKLRRVYYRKLEVIGRQDGYTVIIAREMYVPSDEEAWPPKGS